MITEWTIENFKSVRSKAALDLGPLTLFVGQNSAGKSTVIQSILLTAQTLQSTANARAVVLNGRIIRLGSFSDIHANEASSPKIRIGFSLTRSDLARETKTGLVSGAASDAKKKTINATYSFSAGQARQGGSRLQLQPQLEVGSLSVKEADEQPQTYQFERRQESVNALLSREQVKLENVRLSDINALEYAPLSGTTAGPGALRRAYGLPRQSQAVGVMLRHFLPFGTCVAYDSVAEDVERSFEALASTYHYRYPNSSIKTLRSAFEDARFRAILFDALQATAPQNGELFNLRPFHPVQLFQQNPSYEGLQRALSALPPSARKIFALQLSEHEQEIKSLLKGDRSPLREVSIVPVPDEITAAADYVSQFFAEHLKYLGPLRDEPKAIYPLLGYNDPKDIGFRGEFTAAALEENRQEWIQFVHPENVLSSELSQPQLEWTTLGDAVKTWLQHLGIAKEVNTEDQGKLGHQLTIATPEGIAHHDLTHVGVGVSQALPIVVLSLLAGSGSTLIFEQPELHLNPKVQTRLADFFVSLMLSGKQCIIETHSEYLISRLRYLSAKAKGATIAKNVKIYFVEKPGSESIYREVTITETGAIKNWPEGFFDETERNAEAILRAQLEISRERRKRRDEQGASK